MKVRIVQQISGSRNGQDWPAPGETLEVDDEEGQRLIAVKIAVPAGADEPETATPSAADVETRAPAGAKGGMTTESLAPTKSAASSKVSTPKGV